MSFSIQIEDLHSSLRDLQACLTSVLLGISNYLVYILIGVYLFCFIKAYTSKTKIVGKDGCLKKKVENFHSVSRGYKPSIWCFSAIPNTLMGVVLKTSFSHKYEKEILHTQDGGIIALDWLNRQNAVKKVIMLVVPGMQTTSRTNYVKHYVDIAKRLDCIAVVQNHRGSRCDLLTPRFYSGSNYEDLDLTVQHIRKLYPEHKIFAVGISMGGVQLCGYIAKFNQDENIANALIISSPFDLEITNSELESGFNILLNSFITRSLKKKFFKY